MKKHRLFWETKQERLSECPHIAADMYIAWNSPLDMETVWS
jgi:hypothetical protein